MKFKKLGVITLCLMMLTSLLPTAAFAGIDGDSGATFSTGTTLIGSDGRPFAYPASQRGTIAIHYYNTASGNMAVFYGQAETGEEKRTYIVNQGGDSYRGYCVEHGVKVDEIKRLSALEEDQIEDLIFKGLSEQEAINLELALFYGYQSGDSINDLYDNGFKVSPEYGEHGTGYNWADWYMATQCIIWEIQQQHRDDNMRRSRNDLGVSADHYLSLIADRPAVDIYNWMVKAIKSHGKFPSSINGLNAIAPKEIVLRDDNKTASGYTFTFKDTTGYGGDYIAVDKKGKALDNIKITYNAGTKEYTLDITGEPGSTVFTIKHAANGKPPKDNLLFWGWQSGAGHVQTIATGAADPVERYIKFVKRSTPVTPEPEYFPEFEFPVHKDDLNPGWDGDNCTGMGDASLGATYVLYRNGTEVDRINLDDYGSTEILRDKPWSSPADLNAASSGSYNHVETEMQGDPPAPVVVHDCTVEPLTWEWNASAEYEIREIPPAGRFVAPDTGVRKYTASYYAVTNNAQRCINDPAAWDDVNYTLNYSTTAGTNGATKQEAGTIAGLVTNPSYNEETFINDNYRGKLLIKKQKEAEDVFNEEGGAGNLSLSTKSKWKMRLNSGGYENHPYLRFVDSGFTEDGAKKYTAVRDTSGINNETTDMDISATGSLFIVDIPYGLYTVEEVAADDTSFVLESFEVFVDTDGKQYTYSVTNKKKENVIKVIKTDAETGKTVNLKGTKFYIRYMGNQLLADPSTSKNYGRLLPNAADINSTSKDYTFICDENGEIILPYDLEFGTYRLEEFLLPNGYFVGRYDAAGNPSNADYGTVSEGEVTAPLGMEYSDLVTVYDTAGNHIDYKAGDVFNYYSFMVENQDGHLDGKDYIKYYKAVSMANNAVKGKIEIYKEGEALTGFKNVTKNGYTVLEPVYSKVSLAGATFGIYAAEDILTPDGNEGPKIYDAKTNTQIDLTLDESTHSGFAGVIEDVKSFLHETGAKLKSVIKREKSKDNTKTTTYTTPEQKPTTYSYTYQKTENGLLINYDVDVKLEYQAGGRNVTDIDVKKTTEVQGAFLPEIPKTIPTGAIGSAAVNPLANTETANENVLDVFSGEDIYEANGVKVNDSEGNLIKDLGDIGAARYEVKDYIFYNLTAADVTAEERVVSPAVDTNGDGDTDDPEDIPEVKETKTKYEWDNGVTLVTPAAGGLAIKDEAGACSVLTTNYSWVTSDAAGVPDAQYDIPTGFTELPYIPASGKHYAIITDSLGAYRVYLTSGIWQPCDSVGNFEKKLVQEYKVSYTQKGNNEEGFSFSWDGIEISSTAKLDKTAVTNIVNPFGAAEVTDIGIGYEKAVTGNTTVFTAKEPSAPIYFVSEDGIKTEMYYFGGYTKTFLTIPMDAVEGNFENIVPTIRFGKNEVDWYSSLSPSNPLFTKELMTGNTVKAVRHEGSAGADVYYTIEIISNQGKEAPAAGEIAEQRPFSITYSDGYTAKIYVDKAASGNGIGVMELGAVYKTTKYVKSQLAETITSGPDGIAVSSPLPLGKYIVREISAPEGHVSDTEKAYDVTLSYKDQYTPLVWQHIDASNEAVKVEIELEKVFETAYQSDTYVPGSGAVFGIYNGEDITYGANTQKAGTLLDTAAVNQNGKGLVSAKLPKGIYYLKELKTRTGYELNDTLFYFTAGDDVKTTPLMFNFLADGISGKAVMHSNKNAEITIDTLSRFPAVSMTINGTAYSLDKTVENGNVKITVLKDLTRAKVIVTEANPASITLANGKILNLTVTANTYSYTLDGLQGNYIPSAVYTGYQARYELLEDAKAPTDNTFVLTSAEDSAEITVATVHQQKKQLNDATGLMETVLDKDGNPVIEHFANVTLSKGTLTEAVLSNTNLNIAALTQPTRVDREKRLMLKTDDETIFDLVMDKDGNIKALVQNTIKKALTGANGPKITLNGQPVTDGFSYSKSVTLARQDSTAKTVMVKINTTDNLNAAAMENRAKEGTPDVPFVIPSSPNKGVIEILKADIETGEMLPGAEFEIWSSKKNASTGELQKDKVIFVGETDKDGILKLEIDYGIYFYHETKAPTGYILDELFYVAELKKEALHYRTTMFNEKEKPHDPPKPQKPDKPEKPQEPESEIPKTGDVNNLQKWIWLIMLAVGGFMVTAAKTRRDD